MLVPVNRRSRFAVASSSLISAILSGQRLWMYRMDTGRFSKMKAASSTQVAPRQRGNAFVPCRNRDLERIFSLQFERSVNRDNTVSFQNLSLQIERVNWRATLVGCQVMAHQHLDGTLSLTYGPHCLGRYTAQGAALTTIKMPARRAVEKTRAGKVIKPTFPARLEIPHKPRDSHFPTAPTAAGQL